MFYETFEHFLFAFSIWLKMTGFLTFEKFFEQIFATYFLVNRKCWTLSLKLAVKMWNLLKLRTLHFEDNYEDWIASRKTSYKYWL